MSNHGIDAGLARAASGLTVGALFRDRARCNDAVALEADGVAWTYRELNARANRAAALLGAAGVERGDRVAILSENRPEYIEIELAAAKLGAIAVCMNWRQSPSELAHCLELTAPASVLVSARLATSLADTAYQAPHTVALGAKYEALLVEHSSDEPPISAESEDGLVILFTSGTTGYPKGAVISHRAMIARAAMSCADGGLYPDKTFLACTPLFHIASNDKVIGTLLYGGKSIVMDSFDAQRVVALLAREVIGALQLGPGTVDLLIAELRRTGVRPKGVMSVGAMADLIPLDRIAEITTLLDAPFRNTFGSTETGQAPASRGRIPAGVVPARLSKTQSSFCELRLVDGNNREVPDGTPGEALFRGPSVFSGYWRDPEANAEAFRDGWYRMGDVLVRNGDGTIDYVDRLKYIIKSGGENIYPAEIERLLLASPRIADAVVVRLPDTRWGEVPAALVVRRDESLTEADVLDLCRGRIANYKLPKSVMFIDEEDVPRSTTGKIQRNVLEGLVADGNRTRRHG
jgi:acyl-CoA synthetase (AMP-forming)/AMP-acid ligase II